MTNSTLQIISDSDYRYKSSAKDAHVRNETPANTVSITTLVPFIIPVESIVTLALFK